MAKAFCPSCKFTLYSKKKFADRGYHFKCGCGCEFILKEKYVKRMSDNG